MAAASVITVYFTFIGPAAVVNDVTITAAVTYVGFAFTIAAFTFAISASVTAPMALESQTHQRSF